MVIGASIPNWVNGRCYVHHVDRDGNAHLVCGTQSKKEAPIMRTASARAVLQSTLLILTGLAMILAALVASPSTAEAQPGSGLIFATVVTCIESDTVQDDPAAATMRVGNVYEGNDGTRHLITTGAPLCSFNCAMGFDLNCDGIRGDYCPAGLNLHTVAGVAACLASLEPATQPLAVEPIAVEVGELAYTGSETHTLGLLGLGLLSAGAFMMGARRKVRNED